MKKKKPHEDQGPILVPVDFSAHSVVALLWAADLCQRLDAPLRVMHVIHDPESAPGYYFRSKKKKVMRRIEEAALEMMEEYLDGVVREHPEIDILKDLEPILVPGLPVTRILEVAEEIGARMIAMASQGRTGLPHFLLGSKAVRVVQLSPIPVTIVKGSGRAD